MKAFDFSRIRGDQQRKDSVQKTKQKTSSTSKSKVQPDKQTFMGNQTQNKQSEQKRQPALKRTGTVKELPARSLQLDEVIIKKQNQKIVKDNKRNTTRASNNARSAATSSNEPVKLPRGFEKTIMEMEVSLEKEYTLNKELVVQMLISMYTSAVEHYSQTGDLPTADMYRAKIQMLFAKPNIAQLFMQAKASEAAAKQNPISAPIETPEIDAPLLQKSQTQANIIQPQDRPLIESEQQSTSDIITPSEESTNPQKLLLSQPVIEETKQTSLQAQETPSGSLQQNKQLANIQTEESLTKEYHQAQQQMQSSASQQLNKVSVPFTPVGNMNQRPIVVPPPVDSRKNEEIFDNLQDGRMRSTSVLQKDMLTQQESLKQRLAQRSRSRGGKSLNKLGVSNSLIMHSTKNKDNFNILSSKNFAENSLKSDHNNSSSDNVAPSQKAPVSSTHQRSLSRKNYLSQSSSLLAPVKVNQASAVNASATKDAIPLVNTKGMVLHGFPKPDRANAKKPATSDLQVTQTVYNPVNIKQKFMMTKQSTNGEVNFADLLDDINYIKDSPAAASKASPTKSTNSLNKYLSKGDLQVKQHQPSTDSEFVHLQMTNSQNSSSQAKPVKKVTIAHGFSDSSETNSYVVLDSNTNKSNSGSSNKLDEEQVQKNIQVFLKKFQVYSDKQLEQVSEKYKQNLKAYEKKPQNALTKKLIQKTNLELEQAVKKKTQQLEDQKLSEIRSIKSGVVREFTSDGTNFKNLDVQLDANFF